MNGSRPPCQLLRPIPRASQSLRRMAGETGIQLFRAAQLTGSAVAGSDATADLDRMFALETAADGTVLFASKEAGAHTIFLYEASS